MKKEQSQGVNAIAMIGDPQAVLYQQTVFCQTSLPYRKPPEDVITWERQNGGVAMMLTADFVRNEQNDGWERLGLPFGPKARLILGDINTQAILTQSPLIDMENTLSSFMSRLNIARNGGNIKKVKNSIGRLCACTMRFAFKLEDHLKQVNLPFVDSFDIWFPTNTNQRVLWPSQARLSPRYFDLLMNHAVPLDKDQYFSLSNNAMAMDIYAWLVQRLHRVPIEVSVSWKELQNQFGWNYKRMDHFREEFRINLGQALGAYRDARVKEIPQGLLLRNSPPPVQKKVISTSHLALTSS